MSVHLHIVPAVPPAFNGLGDYCYHLWKHWPEPKPEWHVAAAALPPGAREAWPEATLRQFDCNKISLAETLAKSNADTVVLHYVGYGYERHGAPTWMPSALAAWKGKSGGEIVVMFHELYATGPPWKSEFWFCLAQMRVARQLAQLADRWITSCPRYARLLPEKLGADRKTGKMIPVGSNIEPVAEPDWDRPWPPSVGKKLRIAVFGNPLTRLRALRKHGSLLGQLARASLLEEVQLIGRSDAKGDYQTEMEDILRREATISWSRHENLSQEEASRVLSECHIGLVENAYEILHKSTAYAAYAVHSLLPVIPWSADTPEGVYFQNCASTSNLAQSLEQAFLAKGDQGRQFLFSHIAKEFALACEAP